MEISVLMLAIIGVYAAGLTIIYMGLSGSKDYLIGLFSKEYRYRYYRITNGEYIWGPAKRIRDDLHVIYQDYQEEYVVTLMENGPLGYLILEEDILFLTSVDINNYILYVGDLKVGSIKVINNNTIAVTSKINIINIRPGSKMRLVNLKFNRVSNN